MGMIAALLVLALAPLDIQGDCTCPTATEVGQRLARLVPRQGSDRTGPGPYAYLSSGDGFVAVELLGPDGELLAERRLARTAPCAELAEAVASVLAAWQGKLNPALSTTAVPPPPPPPVVVVASPPMVASPLTYDAGIAILSSLVGGEAAFGAGLRAAVLPFALPLGLDASLSVTTAHTQSTSSPPIEARWIRPALSLGPNLRLRGRSLMLDVHADGVLALLRVQGAGLRKTSTDLGMQLGFAPGLRGLWVWGHGAAWAGADLFVFPGQDRLLVGSGEVGHLPHVEVQVGLGVSLGRFR
jgi:hypothetical protein